MPVVEPIVAIAVLLLVQMPPLTELPNVITSPAQSEVGPVIAVGVGFTVTILTAKQLGPVA